MTGRVPSLTLAPCPRRDSDPHHAHYWGDPEDPMDDRFCPGTTAPARTLSSPDTASGSYQPPTEGQR